MCLRFCNWRKATPKNPSQNDWGDQSKAEEAQPAVTETPTRTGSPPRVKQQPQIPAVPGSLPSQVDETLAECPRFRIVLVGKSGVGKSCLIKNIFNIDPDNIDVAHNRAGEADIEREYTSSENPRFILHDSKGFEPGSENNWKAVETFLKTRQKYELPERIHALWFCVLTPRIGTRLLHKGDEKLLKLAKEFNIPIITVFTKYDQLVNQFFRKDPATAEENALGSFDRSVGELQEEWKKLPTDLESGKSLTDLSIPYVKVSTEGPSQECSFRKQTLLNLTKVTRERLQDVERQLEVLWVAAQHVDAHQKVEISISEGFKKYWLDLGQSSAFEGQILIDCIHRLHDDVLKIWTFNDKTGILSGIMFFTEMIDLIKSLIENKVDETSFDRAYVSGFGTRGAKELVPLLRRSGLKDSAIHYLYDKYQPYPSTAKLLATYIVNLVLILHGIFTDTLPSDPPRVLSNDVVFDVVKRHKRDLKKENLDNINSDPEFTTHPEQVIESVIRKRLPPDSAGLGSVVLS